MTSMHAPPHAHSQQQQQMPHAIPTGPPPVNTTRILELSRFPVDMKTKDIQAIFSPFEDDRGGFKIKWVDDTKALIVFQDPAVAKRALLHLLSNPPLSMSNPSSLSNPSPAPAPDSTSDSTSSPPSAPSQITDDLPPVLLRPYTSSDVPAILASVLNRPRSRSNASSHHHSNSQSHSYSHSRKNSNVAQPPQGQAGQGQGHARSGSFGNTMSLGRSAGAKFIPGHGMGAGSSGSGSWTRGGGGGGGGDIPPVPPLPSVFADEGVSPSEEKERERPGLGEPAKRLVVGGLGGRFAAGPRLSENENENENGNENENEEGEGTVEGLERKTKEMKIADGSG